MKNLKKFGVINENLYTLWELDTKIEKIIDSNIEEVPYEGQEVDKITMKNEFLAIIYELAPEYIPKEFKKK